MDKNKIKKSDIIILTITIALLIGIVIFCALNWHLVITLFDMIVEGKSIVKDFVTDFGWLGVVAIAVVLVFCFFFPFFSALPLEIVCVMSYGIWWSTLLVSLSIAIGSQILFLLEKNLKTFFYTKKQRQKQLELEERIKNRDRNIDVVMVLLYVIPLIPFMIIASIACRSNMKWWKYTLYTTLGVVPEVFCTLLIGNQVTSNSSPVVNMIILVLMILLVILMLIFKDKMIYWIFRPKKEKNEKEE